LTKRSNPCIVVMESYIQPREVILCDALKIVSVTLSRIAQANPHGLMR
jgi:hypothetical protein